MVRAVIERKRERERDGGGGGMRAVIARRRERERWGGGGGMRAVIERKRWGGRDKQVGRSVFHNPAVSIKCLRQSNLPRVGP